MKKQLLCLIFLFLSFCTYSQGKINESLKTQLDSILKSDQILREYSDSRISAERKNEILKETGFTKEQLAGQNVWMIVNVQDSINLIKIEKIILEYGYPGKSLVGAPTNEAAWYVIQHSKKISEYLPLIKKACDNGEIPFTLYAKMLDRYLVQQGKEQLYGTQGQGKLITNKETGKKEFFNYVSPIENPSKVNERRKKAGFKTTVEENAKEMGLDYKIYSLDEIAKMN